MEFVSPHTSYGFWDFVEADTHKYAKDIARIPAPIDTTRPVTCPNCGSDFDGLTCENCGSDFPPNELADPDLSPQGNQMIEQSGQTQPQGGQPQAQAQDPNQAQGQQDPMQGLQEDFGDLMQGVSALQEGIGDLAQDLGIAPPDSGDPNSQGAAQASPQGPPQQAQVAAADPSAGNDVLAPQFQQGQEPEGQGPDNYDFQQDQGAFLPPGISDPRIQQPGIPPLMQRELNPLSPLAPQGPDENDDRRNKEPMSRFNELLKVRSNRMRQSRVDGVDYDQTDTINLLDGAYNLKETPAPENSPFSSDKYRKNQKRVNLLDLDAAGTDIHGGPGDPAVRAAARKRRHYAFDDDSAYGPYGEDGQDVGSDGGFAPSLDNLPQDDNDAEDAGGLDAQLDQIQDQLDQIEDKVDDTLQDVGSCPVGGCPICQADEKRANRIARKVRVARRSADRLLRKVAEGEINDDDAEVEDGIEKLHDQVDDLMDSVDALDKDQEEDIRAEMGDEQPSPDAPENSVPDLSDEDKPAALPISESSRRRHRNHPTVKRGTEGVLTNEDPGKTGDINASNDNPGLGTKEKDITNADPVVARKKIIHAHKQLVRLAHLIKKADDVQDDAEVDDSLGSVVDNLQDIVQTVKEVVKDQQSDEGIAVAPDADDAGPNADADATSEDTAPDFAPVSEDAPPADDEVPPFKSNDEDDEEEDDDDDDREKTASRRKSNVIRFSLTKKSVLATRKVAQARRAYSQGEDVASVLARLGAVDKDLSILYEALGNIKKRASNGREETHKWTDVEDLDGPTATRAEATDPAWRTNVLDPVNEGNQLYIADVPDYYNDGATTGYQPQVDENLSVWPGDPGGYTYRRRAASKKTGSFRVTAAQLEAAKQQAAADAKNRLLIATQLVDRCEKLGMTKQANRYKHIAAFEKMDATELLGYQRAVADFSEHEIRQAHSRRIASFSPEINKDRIPALGRERTASAEVTLEDIQRDDYLAFLH